MVAPRLTRNDWLNAGLKSLTARGHDALKAERLAKLLNVSRGSFYWHFLDVGAFWQALLERWEEIAVDLPYATATRADHVDASTALRDLVHAVFRASVGLERAVRSWATASSLAADAVARVDQRRLTLLGELIARSGAPAARANVDAVILYCAYLGHVASNASMIDDEAVEQLVVRFCGG